MKVYVGNQTELLDIFIEKYKINNRQYNTIYIIMSKLTLMNLYGSILSCEYGERIQYSYKGNKIAIDDGICYGEVVIR